MGRTDEGGRGAAEQDGSASVRLHSPSPYSALPLEPPLPRLPPQFDPAGEFAPGKLNDDLVVGPDSTE